MSGLQSSPNSPWTTWKLPVVLVDHLMIFPARCSNCNALCWRLSNFNRRLSTDAHLTHAQPHIRGNKQITWFELPRRPQKSTKTAKTARKERGKWLAIPQTFSTSVWPTAHHFGILAHTPLSLLTHCPPLLRKTESHDCHHSCQSGKCCCFFQGFLQVERVLRSFWDGAPHYTWIHIYVQYLGA